MAFIEQAYKGKNDWWRYLLALLLVFTGWQVVGIVPIVGIAIANAESIDDLMEASANAFLGLGIDSNLYLLGMLLTFVFGLVFLLVAVRTIHHRRAVTLVTSRPGVDWRRYFSGFVLWFIISLALLVLDYFLHSGDYIFNFKPLPFLILVLISLLFMPLQTAFEELLFRGYLMQGLGILFRNAAVPLLLTSVGFGLLHGFNPEVQKLGYSILIYYIGTGLLFGIITLMDEGTELALGMHAANNIVAAVFVSMDWAVFQTEALFKDVSEPSLSMEMFLPVFVLYPLVIYFFSKKYGWSNWRQKLFGSITPPGTQNEE